MEHDQMTKHKKDHKHPKQYDVQKLSIFNNVTLNVPVNQEQKADDSKKEDGISGCFKSLFKCLKPG